MKPETKEKTGRVLLSLICFTAYIFFFIAVIANTLDTTIYDLFSAGSHTLVG